MHPGSGTLLAFSKRLFVNISPYIRVCRWSARSLLVPFFTASTPPSSIKKKVRAVDLHPSICSFSSAFLHKINRKTGVTWKLWGHESRTTLQTPSEHFDQNAAPLNIFNFSYFNHSVNYSLVLCMNFISKHERCFKPFSALLFWGNTESTESFIYSLIYWLIWIYWV